MPYLHLRTLLPLTVLAALLVLSACDAKQDETGIVARVNGRPISLHQLQLKHDFDQLGMAIANPSVARLKDEYGMALADLVVRSLVFQTLEAKALAVTDAELAEAEAEIRKDYPEGSFEEVLVEEYIDINYWRDELRARLSVTKFFDEVLRLGISIDYREAEDYYREHIQDFYMPSRVRLVRISGPSRDVMENALESYKANRTLEAMSAEFDQISTREIVLREDRLTKDWRDALSGLKPGEVSSIMTAQSGFEALLFAEKIPASVLAPSQAYPAIERELLDRKLMEAFNAWLDQEMAAADITVTPLLELDATDKADAKALEMDVPESPDGELPQDPDGELSQEPEGSDGSPASPAQAPAQ